MACMSTTSDTDSSSARLGRLLVAGLVAFFLFLVLRDAWVGDDAFITLRTVRQWAHGNGLVFNSGERVQAYTHPLWMMLLAAGHALTRELQLTTIFIGVGVSFAAIIWLARSVAIGTSAAAFVLVLCCCSRAVIDYSTSGLENPLTHLLLLVFFGMWFRSARATTLDASRLQLFWLGLTAALALTNRMDVALLLGPPFAYSVWTRVRLGVSWKKLIVTILLAGLPLLSWEIFSLAYYGVLVPNTALAKLNTAVPPRELWGQGLAYLYASLTLDPITLLVILIGLAVPAALERRHWFVALGIVLYLAYVVRIGGDFMMGRFLTGPFFVALALLSQLRWSEVATCYGSVAALLITLSSPGSPLPIGSPPPRDKLDARGIADERAMYFSHTGLRSTTRTGRALTHKWRIEGETADPHVAHLRGAIGFFGAYASDATLIVDWNALSDPLLARLPSRYRPSWRIGHFRRHIPAGYAESVETNSNRLTDPKLRELYDHVRSVTRGKIWSWRRWNSIWKLNTGELDHLVEQVRYRYADARAFDEAMVGLAGRTALAGFELPYTGAVLKLPKPTRDRFVFVDVGANENYELLLVKQQDILGRKTIMHAVPRTSDHHRLIVELKDHELGYDSIRVIPTSGELDYRMWHLVHASSRAAAELALRYCEQNDLRSAKEADAARAEESANTDKAVGRKKRGGAERAEPSKAVEQ